MRCHMFQKIRTRLMLSYIIVLTVILATFAIAVRSIFASSLNEQQLIRLETLARAAALELEIEDSGESAGKLEVDDEIIIGPEQAVQWFDLEGNLLAEQGEHTLKLPFQPGRSVQMQKTPASVKGLTIEVNDEESGEFIGYTRVSESRGDIENTLRGLDLGLAGGIVIALIFSITGGFWLLRQAMEPIERSFRKLQQFTADAAHELRSPLMAIKTNAAVALKYPTGMRSGDAEKFQAISSASTQLTALTENLLFLARTDRKIAPKQDRVNLTVTLEQLTRLYRPLAQSKEIQLQAQLAQNLWVCGDEVQLTRLFANLLDNALHYTPIEGTVEIKTSSQGDYLQVRVRDTGIGIPTQQIDRIFDRFWQADQARSYRSDGFGLGLAIVRGIVETHRGSITVSSQIGEGSCFTVSLPNAGRY